jgi:hypothetical protein
MAIKQLSAELIDLQKAVANVALSLDAFLLNGIQYGVLAPSGFANMLSKTTANLNRDLEVLEEFIDQDKALMSPLRATCQQLVGVVTELIPFRLLPTQQWLPKVALIPQRRAQCVQQLIELETRLQLGESFYSSRSSQSAQSVDQFLTVLEGLFTNEWTKANTKG